MIACYSLLLQLKRVDIPEAIIQLINPVLEALIEKPRAVFYLKPCLIFVALEHLFNFVRRT